MVNSTKVEGLIFTLREYLTHLQDLGRLDKSEVLADPYKVGAARYYLQVSIECCLDIANHVIASERFRSPSTYRETFKILHEVGIIPDDFLPTLQLMASMRNRLVHLYSEIDDHIVFDALQTAPSDCERFVQLILNYTQTSTD
ncbi:MAG: DUF86 domain-containing protein [Anaerolineae bacterium]|nr:DUF86 domain-containing protein [Anaerolineae bacterium]